MFRTFSCAPSRIAALLTVPVLALGVWAPGASAFQATDPAFSPGDVKANPFRVEEVPAANGSGTIMRFSSGPWTIGRSVASVNAQTLAMTYRLQRWTGSDWYVAEQADTNATIPVSQQSIAVTLNSIRAQGVPAGTYRIVAELTWTDPDTGDMLGHMLVVPNSPADHFCALHTTAHSCEVGPGYVQIG